MGGYLAMYLGEDHPRVCGEKAPDALSKLSLNGSPPRVRGEVLTEQANDQEK